MKSREEKHSLGKMQLDFGSKKKSIVMVKLAVFNIVSQSKQLQGQKRLILSIV